MAWDIWQSTIQIAREETRCRHMGYSFRLAAKVILYASSNRQDDTYHGLCYTSRGSLAGTRNSSIGLPGRIDPTTHRTMSERSYHERLTKFVDVSGWVGTTPQSSVQTTPDMSDGVEIRTVSGPVINEINVICPKIIYSVSCCMRCGIIMLKNLDGGVVMEQRNDAMSENVIAVPLNI